MCTLPARSRLALYTSLVRPKNRCRECKLSNAELVVFPCLEVACISVSFRHKQTITTSCARTTTFPLGRTNSLRCSSAPRHAVLITLSLHIMQNWAGCAWPRRGQLYMGACHLLRKRKEEELTGLHIASPLSERRRIYTTCKAAA